MMRKTIKRKKNRVVFGLEELEEFFNFETRGASEGKKRNVRSFVNKMIEFTQLTSYDQEVEFTDNDVYDFIIFVAQDKSINTTYKYVTYLRKFINFLKENYQNQHFSTMILQNRIIRNILENSRVDYKKITEQSIDTMNKLKTYFYNDETIKTFEHKTKSMLRELTYRFFIKKDIKITEKMYDDIVFSTVFLFYTGLRISELQKLRLKDFDFNNDTFIVVRSKISRTTVFPLHPVLKELVKVYVNKYGLRNGFVFSRKKTDKINKVVQENTNFKDFQLKLFRKYFATKLKLNNFTDEEVEYMLGHGEHITDTHYTQAIVNKIYNKYIDTFNENLLKYTYYKDINVEIKKKTQKINIRTIRYDPFRNFNNQLILTNNISRMI